MLLAGTPDGVYRVSEQSFDRSTQVLDASVRQLHSNSNAIFAATAAGVVRTTDAGDTWTSHGLADVHAVLDTGDALYAGVRPTALYCSRDGGETWECQEPFRAFAADTAWPTTTSREEAWVRAIASPDDGRTLLVGVEVGGLLASTDSGASWSQFDAVPDDVHHVLPLSQDAWVVSCGVGGPEGRGGVFETTDGGETWTQRNLGPDEYVRESCFHGRLYTAGSRSGPPWTPPAAALFVDCETGLERVDYPGGPESFVISWETTGADVFAGTNDGRVLRGRGDCWKQLGTVPVSEESKRAWGVRSLAAVDG